MNTAVAVQTAAHSTTGEEGAALLHLCIVQWQVSQRLGHAGSGSYPGVLQGDTSMEPQSAPTRSGAPIMGRQSPPQRL